MAKRKAKRRAKKLKIGIAGMRRGVNFGRLFQNRKDCEVVAVCDLSQEQADAAAKTLDAKPYTNYEEFCKSDIDAVAVVTPPPAHAECTVVAAEHGFTIKTAPARTERLGDLWAQLARTRGGT